MNAYTQAEQLIASSNTDAARPYTVYTERNIDMIEQFRQLPEAMQFEIKVVASVMPFRVNEYVVNELIDWNDIPDDPVFRLMFPQKEMLKAGDFDLMAELHAAEASRATIKKAAHEIQLSMNPHPAGQMAMNAPMVDGKPVQGMQHKYRETALYFPSQGQTCHSYCTFCFRWAQFIGDSDLKMAATEASTMHAYLKEHKELTDLLFTGGDPLVMKTKLVKEYLEPLLQPEFDHIKNIRIGSKTLTFWPYRFTTDDDAQELLALFKKMVDGGKHLAFMAHFDHYAELKTDVCKEAVKRIRATGVNIRAQAPLTRHINDNSDVWVQNWQTQLSMGIIPYYFFVARDTGAKHYFEIPLYKAYEIFQAAIIRMSGLGRTVRGPSMSAGPGKVEITGITEINGEKVFVLRFLQGRNSEWCYRPFFAKYDEEATWLDDLKPAFGEEKFFFEDEYKAMCKARGV
ncbi:lysine 2,3-aminomutase [Endozoicomonas gorgoniicola]|uniref:Lysine 2,3-aminomutase n=1 Tax=Endozoicomonas gorgoniicola TaxID=1234144 RepID=A0ABT3MZ14_9GAMM|nr:lysine 2,3-aminomutase [Endozoicomonas gorgoniicola]MCW7554602.1 lysine 2,3-aminomutase [Endozoicomonas gorgoniicola]